MEEFEEFLRTVPHGRKGVPISQANARTVIRQVKLMVSGAGVGYHHWPSDIFWRPVEYSMAPEYSARIIFWTQNRPFLSQNSKIYRILLVKEPF